jgi:hypothetical protein
MSRSEVRAIAVRDSDRARSIGVAASLAMAIAALALAFPGVAGAKPVKTITLDSATYTAVPFDNSVTITISRSSTKGRASVTFATSDGTATAGSDYTATSVVVNFKSRQSSQTVSVPLLANSETANETVNLALSNPSRGWSLGSPNSAVLTIYRNRVLNGGFESGDFTGWTTGNSSDCLGQNCFPGTAPALPSIDTGTVYAGSDSAFLGDPTSGTAEGRGYTFFYQDVTVPATGTTTLSWYHLDKTTEFGYGAAFDGQQVLILDTTNGLLANAQTNANNDTTWQHGTYDLSTWAGTTVRVYFRVYEDAAADPTSMNVDNVAVTNT